MKIKIVILVSVFVSIILFLLFNINHSYKENILYSQNNIKNYNEKQSESSNLINRDEAIKVAKYYIEDILGNDLKSSDNKMYVNLYRNDSGAESYFWNISWSTPTLSCGVEINTINRAINEIYVNKEISTDINNNPNISVNLTKDEILEIVKDFVNCWLIFHILFFAFFNIRTSYADFFVSI
nr:hypothetical protein [uncultured Terrisporobacter sp.]